MKLRLIAPLALAALLPAGPALAAPGKPADKAADKAIDRQADKRPAFRWDSGAVLSTSRVWRGQLQTGGRPGLVGEVKLSHRSGAYAGVWAGTLDLGAGTDTRFELDYFAGWGQRYGRWSLNAGYLYRQRPSSTMSLDFQELTASVAYDFGAFRPGFGVYQSWDYFQGGRSSYRYANLRVPISSRRGFHLTGVASLGHHDFSNPAMGNYQDMDLRLIAVRGPWQYSVGYSDSNVDPSRSGLLTRHKSGARWRAQALVMF